MDDNNFFDDFLESQSDGLQSKNTFSEIPGTTKEEREKVMVDTSFFLSNAIFSLLVQKGILTEEEVSEVIDDYISNSENDLGED